MGCDGLTLPERPTNQPACALPYSWVAVLTSIYWDDAGIGVCFNGGAQTLSFQDYA